MFTYYDVSKTTSERVGGVLTIERRGILLHTTEGYNSLAWLQRESASAGRPASADFLVNRVGDIYQITAPGRYAYHSGAARWLWATESDGTLNASFLGIELENFGAAQQKVTDEQYIASAALVSKLAYFHELDLRLLAGHYQAAIPAGRKSDPSGFYWAEWWNELLRPSKEAATIAFPAVLP